VGGIFGRNVSPTLPLKKIKSGHVLKVWTEVVSWSEQILYLRGIMLRDMIFCYLETQLFTTFLIWQGGPLVKFRIFFLKKKKKSKSKSCHVDKGGQKLYLGDVKRDETRAY
jgi:hypothetical protein